MDAQTLFRQGVLAIRDQKDVAQGRKLLQQSLRLDPKNDMAWLWLTRTVSDTETRLKYIDYALKVNPANEHALKLKQQLLQHAVPAAAPPVAAPAASPPQPQVASVPAVSQPEPVAAVQSDALTMASPMKPSERKQVMQLLEQAEVYREEDNIEAAIGEWVSVLGIRVDHDVAIRNATGHLWKMNYREDARELIHRAIDAGTAVPFIYMTAIDMAEREHDYEVADQLRETIPAMPNAPEELIINIVDQHMEAYKMDQALKALEAAVESHPDSQVLLVKLGDVYTELQRTTEAMSCYDRAVRLGSRSTFGKEADKRLASYVPVLTDQERGSILLAVREATGFGIAAFLLGIQDAGLDLPSMSGLHWMGIGLSLLGGYFLVTATSSPQQRPLAGLLGGKIPPPTEIDPDEKKEVENTFGEAMAEDSQIPILPMAARYFLGFVGLVMIIAALGLVLNQSLGLVMDYTQPPYPESLR
ncbi:MAG: tetratricopeptide repeat protein [Chloroflexi bacterium]|nr:tetratricopeptide repeat protein [Chloroflexota bacterium]